MIPYGRQSINADDVAAVLDVLRSDWITQGPAGEAFEASLTALTGASHAVAVNSATSALHLACLALGVGPGSMVWTSPNTFVASANCARMCGADVDFVDIDPRTWNLDPLALARKLQVAKRNGRLPDVVIPVHFGGQSCDMRAIRSLGQEYGFAIIEDASHAVGGLYDGSPVGSCRYADIAVFSFHPVKIVTTAEGGAALTNQDALATRLRLLRSHGITREPTLMEQPGTGPWYYEQLELGYNYRMTDLQAALGVSQLKRVSTFVSERQRLAARYDRLLADLPLQTGYSIDDAVSALHLYPVLLVPGMAGRRRAVFDAMRTGGIGVNVHYIPVHTQPYFRRLGFKPGDFPVAEDYYSRALSLPLYPDLGDAGQDRVVATLRAALAAAGAPG